MLIFQKLYKLSKILLYIKLVKPNMQLRYRLYILKKYNFFFYSYYISNQKIIIQRA